MYFREVADGNLREKNCEVRLSIFFLWPNRFWPFSLPDQRVHRTNLIILACRTLLSWPLYDPSKSASLTRFWVWPNRFWPCFGQCLKRPNGHKKTPEGFSFHSAPLLLIIPSKNATASSISSSVGCPFLSPPTSLNGPNVSYPKHP